MWAVAFSMWAVTFSMWAVASSMHDAQALYGLLQPECMLCMRCVGFFIL